MKTLICSLFVCISFCSTLSAKDDKDLLELKKFASEILLVHDDDKSKIYESYRAILTHHDPMLRTALKNPDLPNQISEDKCLSSFLKGKENTLFPYLSLMLGTANLQSNTSAPHISDSQLELLDSLINSSVKDFKFSETTAVTMLLNPENGVDLKDAPPTIRNFLDLVLHRYFDALDVLTKRAILADILLMDENAPPEEVLAVILNHCGPVLQKAFQLFSKDVRSPQLNTVLNRLRQNIKPFSSELAKSRIEKEAGISVDKEFASFPKKPIAAATIAQVYLLHNRSGDKVIVKVQRPGVANKAEGEFHLLRSLTQDSAVLKFILDLEESLVDELDFEKERANIKTAQFYNGQMDGKLQVISDLPAYHSTSKVLFLSCAKGRSIEKFGREANEQKKAALSQLLYVWLHEAVFGARMFHADLHPGNLFLDFDEYDDDSPFTLTMIDFGSVGTFTLQEAKGLFLILVGISREKKGAIFDGLSLIADWKEDVSEKQIRDLIDGLLKEEIPEFYKAKTLFDRTIELGILLPKSILQFYRGEAFIEKQLTEVYQSEFDKEEAKEKSEEAITAIFKSVFRWDIFDQICNMVDVMNGHGDDHALSFFDHDALCAALSPW